MGNQQSVKRRRVRIDGRYKPAQEVKRRVAAYRKQLGGLDEVTRQRVTELAELEVVCSELRASILRGEHIGVFAMDQIGRLHNTCCRLRTSLGLNSEPSVWSTLAMLDAAE
jgi:hypothetical protein